MVENSTRRITFAEEFEKRFEGVNDDEKLRYTVARGFYVNPLSKSTILKFLGNKEARLEVRAKRIEAVQRLAYEMDSHYWNGAAQRAGLVETNLLGEAICTYDSEVAVGAAKMMLRGLERASLTNDSRAPVFLNAYEEDESVGTSNDNRIRAMSPIRTAAPEWFMETSES
jgi:hypothetical protein